jgi:hypothetical protein
VIWCAAAALLVTIAVQPATGDDMRVCVSGTGAEAIAACSRMLALNLFQPSHSRSSAE